jgi:hypothetical protein
MSFQMIEVSHDLHVEGRSDDEEVGAFSGLVIAIGADHASSVQVAPTTLFLVSDPSKPAPLWVRKNEVERQRLGGGVADAVAS